MVYKRGDIGSKIITLVGIIILLIPLIYAQPFGGTLSNEDSQRRFSDSPGTNNAYAGNITAMDISGNSIVLGWQGYFGNVTGVITLDDANNNTLYNWTAASPSGEVYASNESVDWSSIQCFNFTATGSANISEETAGTTSLTGFNASLLNTAFGIVETAVYGVNQTFSLIGTGTHDEFTTNSYQFSEGECPSTRLFDSTGSGQSDLFEEVLLWSYGTNATVFTSLIEDSALGFDGGPHDFEMIVLENGHGTDTSVTNYNFYVELE
jgi:hypothetical protein